MTADAGRARAVEVEILTRAQAVVIEWLTSLSRVVLTSADERRALADRIAALLEAERGAHRLEAGDAGAADDPISQYRRWWTGQSADELKRLGVYLEQCWPGYRQEHDTVTDTALRVIDTLAAQPRAPELAQVRAALDAAQQRIVELEARPSGDAGATSDAP